jgi:hypothetical protein
MAKGFLQVAKRALPRRKMITQILKDIWKKKQLMKIKRII